MEINYEKYNFTGKSKHIIKEVGQSLKKLAWRLEEKSSKVNYLYSN